MEGGTHCAGMVGWRAGSPAADAGRRGPVDLNSREDGGESCASASACLPAFPVGALPSVAIQGRGPGRHRALGAGLATLPLDGVRREFGALPSVGRSGGRHDSTARPESCTPPWALLPVEGPSPLFIGGADRNLGWGYFSGLRLLANARVSNCRAASVRDSIRCRHRNSSKRFNNAGSSRM